MNVDQRTALVTGGAGFIGSHLVEALVARGVQVTVVDNLSNGSLANLRKVVDRITFHHLDIRAPEFTDILLAGRFGTLFHFAAEAYVPPSIEDPDNDFQINLRAPFCFLETVRQYELDMALIIGSSAAVYGNPVRIPMTERDLAFPISPYGVSKLALERYTAVYSQVYHIRAASLRLFSVYGPRQRKQIVYDFIGKLTADPNRLVILGDGSQVRDLVFVEDVVRAALAVWENAPLTGEVYNVATGTGHSTTEIGKTVAGAMALQPEFQYTGQIRPGDAERWIASIDRVALLGFVPQVSFSEGIRRTVAWYQTAHERHAL